jgi:membrane protein implicated in regulation of membrane protease activity
MVVVMIMVVVVLMMMVVMVVVMMVIMVVVVMMYILCFHLFNYRRQQQARTAVYKGHQAVLIADIQGQERRGCIFTFILN